MLPERICLGTSSWTAPSWTGPFYPAGMPSAETLTVYAGRFRGVEVDSTWYRAPHPRTVDEWNRKTPDEFLFAAKVPRTITHELRLLECEADLDGFCRVMRRLGPKLGVLLLQFPYFRQAEFPHLDSFMERLLPFLELLPEDVRFALEIRNRGWLQPPLFAALRRRRVALAWIDHPWMPTVGRYARLPDAVTADFLYVRWLGDRHGIEAVTTTWDTLVVDRAKETQRWVEVIGELLPRLGRVYAFYNNHYAGCGYQSAHLFEEAWRERWGETDG